MYLTLNSEFRPFTYDELVKPLSDYTEAYNKVEEQYATLAQQTEAWKNIATQENSPEAYAMYKRYADELNAVLDDFSRGMTIQNRSKLTGLKSRYASEITPISIAYDAYQKANAYRDTIKGQDDSAIFNIDRYYSLDDFLNGQIADNSFISGRTLQADIASQVLTNGYNKYNELIKAGYSKQAAAKEIAKGDWIDKDSMLSGIYDNTGITTEEAAAKIRSYTDNGIAQGITALSSNIESTLLQEQAARAVRYSGGGSRRGSGNSRQTSSNMDDILLYLYDTLGFSQEYTTEDKEVTSRFMNESGEWVDYSKTITPGEKKFYTKDQKLSRARSNPNLVEAARFIQAGMDEELAIEYFEDFRNYSNAFDVIPRLFFGAPKKKIKTFEEYMGYVNDYALYRESGGTDTFEQFIEEEPQAEEE